MLCMCLSVWMSAPVSPGALRDWKGQMPLELELQALLSNLMSLA